MNSHDIDQLVVDETCRLIDGIREAVARGDVSESVALGVTASDILAVSMEMHRAGRLVMSAWLVEQAAKLAVEARAIKLASLATVPDTAEGLDKRDPEREHHDTE